MLREAALETSSLVSSDLESVGVFNDTGKSHICQNMRNICGCVQNKWFC